MAYFNKQKLKNLNGFTLAEVLITLVIIGIIAAMTVPTLISKYRKQETASRLKKCFTTIKQAVNRSIADNGFPDTWEFTGANTNEKVIPYAEKYILPYLQTVKVCKPSSTECWTYPVNPISNQTNYLGMNSNCVSAILSDGSRISIIFVGDPYAYYAVDINGEKGPNTIGVDMFVFIISHTREGMEARGGVVGMYNGNSRTRASHLDLCKTNAGAAGMHCGDLIMLDGWQIKDDYPWIK